MDDEAFVESSETAPRRNVKSIKLAVNEDGSIDWDSTSAKHTQAFIDAVKVDPNGILKNIQEEAGTQVTDVPSGIADTTVLAATNIVMMVEALGISIFPGPRIIPQLKNLHPLVAIKACAVSMEDIKPIQEPAKRLIKEFIPEQYLEQKYQDMATCAEHLAKLTAEKFASCLKLAKEIEDMKNGQASRPNGRVTIIDAEEVKQ